MLYASHPDFPHTNAIMGAIGEGSGGVTEALRRIVLPPGGPLADTDHVVGYELVHAFQYNMTTLPDAPPGRTGANALPLWLSKAWRSTGVCWSGSTYRQGGERSRESRRADLPGVDFATITRVISVHPD